MNPSEVTAESYITKDLQRDKNRKFFVKDVYNIRVRHEPTGKVVEMEEGLPRDNRKWTDICLVTRKKATEKLARLIEQ
jgi:hypothetical protein